MWSAILGENENGYLHSSHWSVWLCSIHCVKLWIPRQLEKKATACIFTSLDG